jgi:uncharacterized damage-inducible protein DinB
MPQSDPLQILLLHDRWATGQLLDACEPLAPEQFHRRFEIGPGSLHDTFEHMLDATGVWIDTLAGDAPRPSLEVVGTRRTVAEFRVLLEATCRELDVEAARLPLDAIVTRVRHGKTFHFTRAAILTHVATHGVHHRAQCLNMLRQLGVKPLPPSSVTEWTRMGET